MDLSPYAGKLRDCGYDADLLSIVGQSLESGFTKLNSIEWPDHASPEARTALSLFGVGLPQKDEDVQKVFGELPMAALVDAGLISNQSGEVTANWSIVPFSAQYTVSDFYPFAGRPLTDDYVLPPSNGTRIADWLTVLRSGGQAWDIGTGQGHQAVKMALGGMKTIATDITDRSLQAAALTAALNGATGIDFRKGSFLEPFGDDKADLILSNPPFILSTGDSLVGISAGWEADSAVEHLVRESPKHLNNSGWLCMTGSWYSDNPQDWSTRPREWFKDSGCNVWIIKLSETDPDAFAEEMKDVPGGDSFDPAAWENLKANRKIQKICYGVFLAQKISGPTWLRAENIPAGFLRSPHQGQIERVFANTQLMFEGMTPQQAMKRRFQLATEIELVARGQEYQLQQKHGFAMPINVSPPLAKAIASWSPQKWPSEILGPHIPDAEQQKMLLAMLIRNGYLELVLV